jgi:hypothetical protein
MIWKYQKHINLKNKNLKFFKSIFQPQYQILREGDI